MENRILGIVFHTLAPKELRKSTIEIIQSSDDNDDTSAPTVIKNLELFY